MPEQNKMLKKCFLPLLRCALLNPDLKTCHSPPCDAPTGKIVTSSINQIINAMVIICSVLSSFDYSCLKHFLLPYI